MPVVAVKLEVVVIFTEQTSDLDSFEFNVRSPAWYRFRGIAGLRYINLYETLVLSAQAPPTQSLGWHSTLNNNLFGGQIGGDLALFQFGRFQLSSIAKAGVYANAIFHDSDIAGVPAPGHVKIGDTTTNVAFLGELQVLGTYQFTPFLLLNAGYQALWFDKLALQQDQLSAVKTATGRGIDRGASPLYHGAIIQAVVAW